VPGRPRRAEAHHANESPELAQEPLDDRQTGRRDVQVELLVEPMNLSSSPARRPASA
jgi:hypothetical protein